jgi:YVTN family beta-propeller protein
MKLNRSRNVFGLVLLAAACSSTQKPATSGGGSPALKAYAGLFGDNAVAVIDTSRNQVTRTIPVPPGPHGLVITPDGRKVFVSSDGATTVSVIDTTTDAVVASIDVGMTPHGLSMSSDGEYVLLSGYGTDLAEVIDTGTNQIVGRVAVPRPHNSAISLDGKTAYVGSQDQASPSIDVVSLDAGPVTATVPVPRAPRALDFSAAGKVYFTVTGVNGLEVLDTATNQLAAPIPTGGSPHHMVGTKDGDFELVVSQTAGDLEYVDVKSQTVVAAVPTGKAPHWIGLTPDGSRAYVTNESDNNISVVDVARRKVVATIPVGNGPRKIAVQPMVVAP